MSNSCLLVSQRTECDCFTVSCAAVRSSCVVCQLSHTNAIDSITHSEPNRMEWTRICFNGYSSGACPHTRSTPNGLLFQQVVAGQEETQRTLNTKICRLDFFTSRSPGVHSLQMSSGVATLALPFLSGVDPACVQSCALALGTTFSCDVAGPGDPLAQHVLCFTASCGTALGFTQQVMLVRNTHEMSVVSAVAHPVALKQETSVTALLHA